MTLPELLRLRAQELGDAPLLHWRDEFVSYAQFDAATDAVAAGLAARGIGHGDVVSVFAANSPAFLEAWWAILKLGAVFNPVNAQYTADEAGYVVRHAGARLAVCGPEQAGRLQGLPIVTTDALPGAGGGAPDASVAPGDLAALVYTSGTTGRPKGAMLTHANYLADARMFAELVPAVRGDRMGMILPLFHVNAQVATTLTPLLIGGSIVMWERFSASSFWDTVRRHRPVTISAVPTILAALLHAPGAAGPTSLRYVICGAAPLSRELFVAFEERFGLRILEGYGLTEGTCVSSLNPHYGPRKVGSIGLPLRGQPMRLHEPDARGYGEIVVRGPNVMAGYYRDPEATAEAIRDGWLHTGDVGYVDEDGFFFLVDRRKDMIIRGGENVYPREVEEVLEAHPMVREAAVVGVPDPVRGEEVHAVVLAAPGATPSADALQEHCRARLAPFKVPRSFELRDELPRTPTGKVRKAELRDNPAPR